MKISKLNTIDNLLIERQLWDKGLVNIIAIDEAGRGCCAGPVVAGSVMMPIEYRIPGLTDSKSISKKKHNNFQAIIKETAIAWGVGEVEPEVIDQINIKKATQLAMKKAVENLLSKQDSSFKVDYILIDGTEIIDINTAQESIIDGDVLSHSISAASIIAKTYRDAKMALLDKEFDYVYDWSNNAGYQAKKHIDAIKKYGITQYHRKEWITIKRILSGTESELQLLLNI